ncbi:MAG: 4-carboxy-4-hydroxy-2-oxoadipate aldolase/oxaloacetate decarboxylase [Thermoplasmatales archaeon]|nr:4-carboxy-4-hydroxy-2-oxoadipate aldolase/oxaloacetate decarboxylase [Thermoplasmatales archaeon]
MTFIITKGYQRSNSDAEYSKLLAEFGVATVSEAQDKKGVMNTEIKPIQTGRSVAGRAVTVECTAADNLMIHAALEFCKPGDVLVVSTPKEAKNGFFGELMATSAMKRGVAALIIDGGVRDSQAMRDMNFPVWSRYVYVIGTSKKNPGNVNLQISCSDVKVNPGDYVVADDDGVVVVAKENIDVVLEKSGTRVEKEKVTRDKLQKGELSMDFYGLRKVIEDLKIEYRESGT